MAALQSYLETLKLGAWASIAGLAVGVVCLVLLLVVLAQLAAIRKALPGAAPRPPMGVTPTYPPFPAPMPGQTGPPPAPSGGPGRPSR